MLRISVGSILSLLPSFFSHVLLTKIIGTRTEEDMAHRLAAHAALVPVIGEAKHALVNNNKEIPQSNPSDTHLDDGWP